MRPFPMAAIMAAALSILSPTSLRAQATEPCLGQLMIFAGNFCPRGWTEAQGQLLPISSNTALFSILGTIYGGDGRTTFALPDLRGRAPIGLGQGPGLPAYAQGERIGSPTTTLTIPNMPAHSHQATGRIVASEEDATLTEPSGASLATTGGATYTPQAPGVLMADGTVAVTVQPSGGSQPVSIQDPALVIRYCIATVGIFCSRN